MEPEPNTPISKMGDFGGDAASRVPFEAAVPDATARGRVPVAFISYSHDTKEHKAWVASLAQRLRAKGIDVLFDQWDLGPGDDVPKFMEQAVARAERVLMICTDSYVRKADDGKGGVGYEAMVVTGELVRDLGTNKFIPIIRQKSSPKTLPRCVSTRFYIDLSDDAQVEENFDLLLREIHNAPRLPKPPLGQNPFSTGTFAGWAKEAAVAARRLEFSECLANPEAAYERALEIIHADDRVAWRRLLLAANEQGAEALRRWRADKPTIPPLANTDCSARFAHIRSGVEGYEVFIACLVAAAETGTAGYADQLSWVETVLDPAGYDKSGAVYHATFPQTVLFVTQAFVGGMLMLSGAGEGAYQLATAKVPDSFRSRETLPLFSMTPCNGWPESLEHCCTVAWGFLNSLISSWSWLKKAFGAERECRAGIAAYYQMLSFLNFVKLVKDGELDSAQQHPIGKFPVTVALCFCVWPRDAVASGYKSFLRQSPILRRVLGANRFSQADFETAWGKWIEVVGYWLGQVYMGRWPEMTVPQGNLPRDMNTDPYSLG